MTAKVSGQSPQIAFGRQLCEYRARSERERLRDLGFGLVYYFASFFLLLGAFFMTAPLIALAHHMGANPRGVVFDPFWGPIVIAWFVVCFVLFMIATYVWPRRIRLEIYEEGFVYQRCLRRHAVRFDQIAECIVVQGSRGLTLVLADSTRLWFQNFLVTFPQKAVVQLLEHINQRSPAAELQDKRVDVDLKKRFRCAGWVLGLVVYAMPIVVPIAEARGRAVMVRVFGKTVWGIPTCIFVPLLFAVLFAPFPYVLSQCFMLTVSRQAISSGLYDARELRGARITVALGLLYFIILALIWMAFAR